MRVPSLTACSRVRIHLAAMAVWAFLIIPTLIWWRDSILWIAFMSIWANFVGHYGAYEAARDDSQDSAGDSGQGCSDS